MQVKTVNVSQEIVHLMRIETPNQIKRTGIAYPGCSRSEVVFIVDEKAHIKYEETTQLWCELLADEFYRILGIPVPETRALEIDGNLVRASSWIEGHIPTKDEFIQKINKGFIVDCLLSNWDIVAKLNNSIIEEKTRELYRTDNGGALLFRACGLRKETFDGIVAELESTRHSYPLLTDEEIKDQVSNLKANLTDEVIENKVDSVPLSKNDSDYLKTTLKQRRDFIINYYNKDPDLPAKILPIGNVLEEILSRDFISNDKEWSAYFATRYMMKQGYSRNDIAYVNKAILNI